jgi:tRNA-specific 2-thiouridylase
MIDFLNVDKNANIVVAMSGGVDSSATVALLQEAGYKNIIGITLLLHEDSKDMDELCRDQIIIDDCNQVAKKLGIEHHFLELKDTFKEIVMAPYVHGTMSGITLNPCVTCNRDIKFGALLRESQKFNCDILVTGHYIKWAPGISGQGEIHKGYQQVRDQSYFLSQVRRDAIKHMRFPLSGFTKDQTRKEAERLGLHVAFKKSSADLCFIGSNSHKDLMEQAQKNIIKGNIVDINGKVLGEHQGIHHFTIGQRKGIGVGGQSEAFFVVKIDSKSGDVTIGPKEALAKKEMIITDVNWLGDEDFTFKEKTLMAKVRAAQPLAPATIYPMEGGKAKVVFAEPVYGVADGQICAFYSGDRLMGGGYL